MNIFVERTCTEICDRDSGQGTESASTTLQEFREAEAFVLLGGPGLGKTTSFRQEADATGSTYVTARDFLTIEDMPEWHNTTLFIDGLDEVRAGKEDGRTPFDAIRNKLYRLGRPRFRLSCREADWYGANDRERLRLVSPSAEVKVLRLDQLSDQNIQDMLQARSEVQDPDAFINAARQRGIEGLLRSPQGLEMLADSVAGSNWPSTRTETLELACRRLLHEHNQEHQLAVGTATDISCLMHAAGQLCALQLLTGTAGFALLSDTREDPDLLGLDQVNGENRDLLRQVIGSKLFKTPSEGCAIPVHRQVAEFLAGRYLADCIKGKGLPVRRALSLMTGRDGTVVSELRGLSAWLAAHCRTGRREITRRDPLGVVLYGDAREFSIEDKRLILTCLEVEARQNPAFWTNSVMDSRLGDLATPSMVDEFRKIISDTSRSNAHQFLVWILLMSLTQAPKLPGLADLVLNVIRDKTRTQNARLLALETYVHSQEGMVRTALELRKVLDHIVADQDSDPEQVLRWRLLDKIYPKVLSPSELVSYLPVSSSPMSASLEIFFGTIAPERSDGAQAAELMDALTDSFGDLVQAYSMGPAYNINMLSRMISNSLLCALEQAKNDLDPNRLYDWLGVASDLRLDQSIGGQERVQKIRNWLCNHPDMQKSLIRIGLARSADKPDALGIGRRLFDAVPPGDFGRWCLREAGTAVNPSVAEYFLSRAIDAEYGKKRPNQIIEKEIASNLQLQSLYAEIRDARKQYRARTSRNLHSYDQRLKDRIAKQQQQRKERHENVKAQEALLRKNRASPQLLFFLAKGYLGGFGDIRGATPWERLQDLLDGDKELAHAVLQSFRETITRSDLPDVKTILELEAQSKLHFLTLPFMAGLHELGRVATDGDLVLSEEQMQLAIAIHLSVPLWPLFSGPDAPPADREPKWFAFLLKCHPAVVADVLMRFARGKLRRGSNSVSGLHQLGNDNNYRTVARLASLPLLAKFPTRCKKSQLADLRQLLHAACLNCEKDSFANLIEQKLASRSMNPGQRVFWLAAGLLALPEKYAEDLDSYVAGNEHRIRYLAWILARWFDMPSSLLELLDVPGLRLLIRQVGTICRPHPAVQESNSREGGFVTSTMESGLSVGGFINRLAAIPSETATNALAELSSDEGLIEWRSMLLDSIDRQSVVRREAEFEHCSPQQVLETLGNLKPANFADIAALTMEELREISQKIRHGNTSGWRQYWDRVAPKGPLVPLHENECRNALLSDLQERLMRFGIDAQPEGQHADEKRSDIRVAYSGHIIPIEVKKSCSPDLWSAIWKQLIAQYTRDPGADGYGIYLVFWFGNTEYCRPTPGSSSRPQSATELQKLLLDTLSEEERRRISVFVIDVARP